MYIVNKKLCCKMFKFIYITFVVLHCDANFNLSIIHFNDFHARYEPIDKFSTSCEGSNCIGGFSRLYSLIHKLQKNRPNSILLNAGDNFQGSFWYIIHKWNVTQHFLNKLQFDAITLGNHEFDDGIDILVSFLQHFKSPVVVANIDDRDEPKIQNLYNKSIIVNKYGKRIGVIGAVTTTTSWSSSIQNVYFKDELTSINTEAKLLEDQGIFTNIVLSHCGYENDIKIADGGHTDTFLYTGSDIPGPDKPLGPYPTVVLNEFGGKVLVVQASAHSKYLGDLSVSYDQFGNVTNWNGNPIFLASNLPTDSEIDTELATWKKYLDVKGAQIVGFTKIQLPDKVCRSEECILGNFATDAMLFQYSRNASAAMIHAGGIRAGISQGNISIKQLLTTFPFQDTINLCLLKGKHIKQIFESAMSDKHLKWPHLYQVSGLQIVYNISKPEDNRIQLLKIRCQHCASTTYDNINEEKNYWIIMPQFLSDSGFNPLLKKSIIEKIVGRRDSDVYTNFLAHYSPIFPKIESRVQIIY